MPARSLERTGSPPPPVGEQGKDFTLDNGSVVHTDENGIPYYIEVPPEGDETTPESGQESGAEYGDVEPGQESAEDAAEVQANETLRTDAEILGNRYPVSQMIKGAGNTLQWGKERAAAAWNNAMEQPGLLMDKFMHGLAQSSYDRRKAKLDEVAHLSDNHPLKKFRMRKLQKAEARLNKRKANLEIRQNRMTGRVEAVKNAYEARREATIAELSERADKARARKALREEMRSKRKEQNENVDVGWFEAWVVAKKHVDSMPKYQRRRIASAVMNAAEASKNSQEASWQARYAERASADAQNRVESIGGQLQQTRTELNSMRQQAGEIANMESDLVSVRENAAKLQEKADSLSDDSANKFAAMYEAVKAQQQQENMEKAIADYHKRLAELQRQETQLAQSLIQAQKDVENTGKEFENRARAEAAAKKKAEATQQARDRSVENTFV
ncbi:hypothetical protein HG438_003325 [Candidatus Saccharibacteria bacterium]|nr:hypothetical protein [Candidatus Saccharibacteria bacterium]